MQTDRPVAQVCQHQLILLAESFQPFIIKQGVQENIPHE